MRVLRLLEEILNANCTSYKRNKPRIIFCPRAELGLKAHFQRMKKAQTSFKRDWEIGKSDKDFLLLLLVTFLCSDNTLNFIQSEKWSKMKVVKMIGFSTKT